MVNYFYLLTEDISYWYLGMALFFLPQLPMLLEHLGITATRGLETVCNGLANLFIGKAILQSLTEDEGRLEQKSQALSHADARVNQARKRLKNFVSSSVSFFTYNEKIRSLSANDEYSKNTAISRV